MGGMRRECSHVYIMSGTPIQEGKIDMAVIAVENKKAWISALARLLFYISVKYLFKS
jgi:hypothetical protein